LVHDPLAHHDLASFEKRSHAWLTDAGDDVRPRLREQHGGVAERIFRVDHGQQGLVVNLDQLGRVDRFGQRFGDHRHDGLPYEAHNTIGEKWAGHDLRDLVSVEPAGRQAEVGNDEDVHHPGSQAGLSDVGPFYAAVSQWRAHVRHPRRPGQLYVTDVGAADREELQVLFAQYSVPEDAQ
jgi:hypothetical protein